MGALFSRERRWSSWLALGAALLAVATAIALGIAAYEVSHPELSSDVHAAALANTAPEYVVATGLAALAAVGLVALQKWVGSLVAWASIWGSGIFFFWAVLGTYNGSLLPTGVYAALVLGLVTWLAAGAVFVSDMIERFSTYSPVA